jgi:uncharacterized protein (DUF488 family)
VNESDQETPVVFTVGHSTRPLEAFIEILGSVAVALVADVRTMPRSRHNPQFNRETLPRDLAAVGLGYVHLPELGGLRRTRPDSPNQGWRSPGFRGFADYMQTPEFAEGLRHLLDLARQRRTAVMCAEALPWRCHRSLIADALLVRGLRVEHLLGPGKTQTHRLTPFASVAGTRLTYPPAAPQAEEGSQDK